MKWLVSCDAVAVDADGEDTQGAALSSETSAPDVLVEDNGEELTEVSSRLATWWVYSWIDFKYRPRRLLLRNGLVDRLVAANARLPDEFQLVIIDGWRPRSFQYELYSYYKDLLGNDITGFVADPGTGAVPPHTTGGAVDLTLRWRGAPLGLGSDFDEFSPAAAAGSGSLEGLSSRAQRLRALMSRVLQDEGFVPYPLEWWHWSYGDQLWAKRGGHRCAIYNEVKLGGCAG